MGPMLSCVVRKFKMVKVIDKLKAIDPTLKHIKLDKKHAEAFPNLLHVFKCHAQATDYMIQFFKDPVIESCVCKGCTNGLFKPIRMPRQVYDSSVMKFPMPMPIIKQVEVGDKSSDLHYLSFTDAQVSTSVHQQVPTIIRGDNFARCG